ncbi:MAG: hypothetical protein GXO63_00785 [Candidatus Micrarchaeota archaeon]|nr:hypothetical protein [Candidatus Micrarchaeota archaeon]
MKLPFVSDKEKWKYENGRILVSRLTCKDPGEAMTVDTATGEAHCSSGITEVWKESDYMKFLVDNATVYFAGGC